MVVSQESMTTTLLPELVVKCPEFTAGELEASTGEILGASIKPLLVSIDELASSIQAEIASLNEGIPVFQQTLAAQALPEQIQMGHVMESRTFSKMSK